MRLSFRQFARLISLSACLIFLVLGFTAVSSAQQPDSGVVWDLVMRIPSPEDTSSWFPTLAVDREERVHVVWNQTDHQDVWGTDQIERVYYSMWDGHKWSPFNDILPPQRDIIRNALAVDGYDTLHLVFGWFDMYYKYAQAGEALSAASWSSSRLVNGRRATYMKDIAVYGNTLHLVYDDASANRGECPNCGDIFYRHSPDLGRTWSAPAALFPTDAGSARVQIDVDKMGVIYVTWDEGWDRFSGHISPQLYGVYVYSADGGNTWSTPTKVGYPAWNNTQLSVGSNGQGGVMLVWRSTSAEYPAIYYMWSVDYGKSWAPPQTLPGVVARAWDTPFDRYDMATDSAGHIHLLVVGHLSARQGAQDRPGLYHFEWDGDNWSSPTQVYKGTWYPEYPHLVISQGNQLHATWFIRADMWATKKSHQIWYAHGQASAPAETPVALPTFTPVPTPSPTPYAPTPTSAPTRTPTPTPTLDPALLQSSVPSGTTDAIYTDTDELMLLAKSLLPAAMVVIVVAVAVRRWRR